MKSLFAVAAAVAAVTVSSAATAERLYGLTADNRIVTFNSTNPGVTTSSDAITGLQAGENLTGIDLRPANRTLYSVSSLGNLYAITPSAGAYTATLVGPMATANGKMIKLKGTRFGIDFNPQADRLRLMTDYDFNYRINPDTGVTIVDGTLSGPGAEAYVGSAYTNNRAGATSTQLYAIDAGGNQLALSTNPNAGTFVDIGVVSGMDFGALNNVGFDISGRSGIAFLNNGNRLYTLNLTSAQATSLGTIGAGSLVGLTAAGVPEPATWALMILGFGLTAAAMRRRNKATVRFA
jgi:hypothetical protein